MKLEGWLYKTELDKYSCKKGWDTMSNSNVKELYKAAVQSIGLMVGALITGAIILAVIAHTVYG